MKNWLSPLVGLCSLLFVFSACEKDETQATLTPSNAPTLTTATTSVVLNQANETRTAITYTWTPIASFNWSNAEHPYNPAVMYSVQIDKQGNNFAAPVSLAAGNGPTTVLRVDSLNAALNGLGLTPGTATPVEVRLRATYAANSPLYSPVLPLTATAYRVCVPPNSDRWSIIGSAGVDWNTDVQLTYNCDTRTYDLTRAMNVGEFKFRKNGNWSVNNVATNYGSSSSTGGPLVLDGPNIAITTAGTYTIKLNIINQTYTLTR